MSVSSKGRVFSVEVDDEPTLVAAPRTMRKSLTVRTVSGDVELFPVEAEGDVEFGGGFPLFGDAKEAKRWDDYNGAVYAVCDTSGTAELRVEEIGG